MRTIKDWFNTDVDVREVNVAIGEPALIQTDWKTYPFAITILGRPEIVDTITVRLPIRVTAVTFRWTFADEYAPHYIGFLLTDPDGEGDTWWPSMSGGVNVFQQFEDTILAMGGSREGFIYFEADDDTVDKSVPDQPFALFEYFNDEADCFVQIDLTRSAPIWEPIRFEEGARSGDVPVEGISERLAAFGIKWVRGDGIPTKRVGDTVTVTNARGDPWADLTVLGQLEMTGQATARILLRIASRMDEELRLDALGLELSSAPDASGRITRVWEQTSFGDYSAALVDSSSNATLSPGEAREAYMYFRAPIHEEASSTYPLVTLWYWYNSYPLPIGVVHRE